MRLVFGSSSHGLPFICLVTIELDELRGFAPIGVLEQWSVGVMGELVLNKAKERNKGNILAL